MAQCFFSSVGLEKTRQEKEKKDKENKGWPSKIAF